MEPLPPLSRTGTMPQLQSSAGLTVNTPYPAQLELERGEPLLKLRLSGADLKLPLKQLPIATLSQALTATFVTDRAGTLQLQLSFTANTTTIALSEEQQAFLLQPRQLEQLTQQLNRGQTVILGGKPLLSAELQHFISSKLPVSVQLNNQGELLIQLQQSRQTTMLPLSYIKDLSILQSLLATNPALVKQSVAGNTAGDVMKTSGLEKVLQLGGLATEQNSARLQPGIDYYARLQTGAKQAVELVLQTAQGPLRLPLQQLPTIPSGVPLLVQFQQLSADRVAVQIKVLTGVATEILLTAAQSRLLQDPKQLAALQQLLSRGEAPPQLAGEPLKLPLAFNRAAQTLSLQLINLSATTGATTDNKTLQLAIQPVASEQVLQLSTKDFIKPLPWQSAPSAATIQVNLQDSPAQATERGWRQLLPLLNLNPVRLAALPEMPAAVVALLQQVRQAQPAGTRVLSVTEIQQQLQAVLQFQPLQAQPNLNTGAGTLAVAIQLLLGHLLRQPLGDTSKASGKNQQLAQQIGQLDNQQASQLLRALGSHSSLLQLSQLQNADLPQLNQQWFIPLALQQQQESRFSEILLEQREADGKTGENKQKYWQLTMKFDLSHYGQLLAVAKLAGQDVQLQFYTDQPAALRQAEKFLPLLTERCQAQGLNVSKAGCQLGKIPDTLGTRRTSLIATQV